MSHGISRENVRLQPWRYIHEIALYLSHTGRIFIVTAVQDKEKREDWGDSLTVIHTHALSAGRQADRILVSAMTGAGPGLFWVTPDQKGVNPSPRLLVEHQQAMALKRHI